MNIFLNILGALSVPVTIAILAFVLSPNGNNATGYGWQWYLIFVTMTGGLLLVFTLLSFWLTFRFVKVSISWIF